MKRHVATFVLCCAFLVTVTGCSARLHRASPTMQDDLLELTQGMDVLPEFPTPEPSSGSLWVAGGLGESMFKDPRAFRLNDLLTIRIDESSLGTNESNTDLNRSSQADVGASVAFGLEQASPETGKFNLNKVLGSSMETQFSGDGTTTRRSNVSGRISTRVLRVLPNGDLVVAGQKSVMINRERQVITLVGSVRSLDIGRDNSVLSSRVGNLTLRMWGQGEIDSTVRQGWFMRVLNRIWPL